MIVVAVLSTAFNTLVLAWFVRRLIGVPVGWPRTILLSLLMGGSAEPVVRLFARVTGADLSGAGPSSLENGILVLLLIGWLLAIEAAVLVVLEVLVPTGSLPDPLWIVRTLPARWRRLRRYLGVLRIALRHGLIGYLGRGQGAAVRSDPTAYRTLVAALMEGGATFIKLGQMLATRPDLIPPPLAQALSALHDRAEPEPWSRIEPIVVAELGRPLDEVFAELDHTPIAAASVGQVHLGRLRDEREVVVKVQRPGARQQVLVDLDIMTRLATRLEQRAGWARALGLRRLIDGFSTSLHEELDYTVEVENTLAVEHGMTTSGSSSVRAPHVYRELSGPRLLVMERAPGTSLARADELLARLPAARRSAMADDLVLAVLTQMLVTGVFHADLHAGNLFVAEDGTVTLIDFGSVGRLGRTSRASLNALLLACSLDNPVAATDALIALLGRPPGLDDRRLETEMGEVLVRFQSADGGLGSQRLVVDLLSIVVNHGFSVPNQLAAAFRCFGALEGTLRVLDPQTSAMASAERQRHQLMSITSRLEEARDQLMTQAMVVAPLAQRLPRRIDNLLTDAENGRLRVSLDGMGQAGTHPVATGMQQMLVALVAGCCAVCGILLMMVPDAPALTPRVTLTAAAGSTLLLFGFVLSARILARAFRATD